MSFKSFWNTYIIPQRTKENPAPGAFTIVPGEKIDKLWDDYTGKAAIDQQNQWQLQLAKYQSQVQEDFYNKYSSPAALMRQYQEAGLNPNLVYGNAASGQSNVPSFQAPNIQRNMSGSDQLAKGLSLIGQLLGIKQMIYQTDAAREASEQSAIKTMNDSALLSKLIGDLRWENTALGLNKYVESFSRRWKDKRHSDPAIGRIASLSGSMDNFLDAYQRTYRRQLLYKNILPVAQGFYDYGVGLNPDFTSFDTGFGLRPIQVKQSVFNYNWDQEYKSYLKAAGIASPIIQTLIRLFGGK